MLRGAPLCVMTSPPPPPRFETEDFTATLCGGGGGGGGRSYSLSLFSGVDGVRWDGYTSLSFSLELWHRSSIVGE